MSHWSGLGERRVEIHILLQSRIELLRQLLINRFRAFLLLNSSVLVRSTCHTRKKNFRVAFYRRKKWLHTRIQFVECRSRIQAPRGKPTTKEQPIISVRPRARTSSKQVRKIIRVNKQKRRGKTVCPTLFFGTLDESTKAQRSKKEIHSRNYSELDT